MLTRPYQARRRRLAIRARSLGTAANIFEESEGSADRKQLLSNEAAMVSLLCAGRATYHPATLRTRRRMS